MVGVEKMTEAENREFGIELDWININAKDEAEAIQKFKQYLKTISESPIFRDYISIWELKK